MNLKFYLLIGIIVACVIIISFSFYSPAEEHPTFVIKGRIVRNWSPGGTATYGFETNDGGQTALIEADFHHNYPGPSWFGFFDDFKSTIRGDWTMTSVIDGIESECKIGNPNGFLFPNLQGVSYHEYTLPFYGLRGDDHSIGETVYWYYTLSGKDYYVSGTRNIEWRWF